jgi:regulator of sigma E protease
MSEILQGAVTILLFFLILGSLVLIHELGHFVTARLAGVRVLEFGIGFPPRAKVLRSHGETLYTLNWLPIGGFVKLEGEDGGDGDDPRSFVRARLPTKLIILVAGVAMNLFIALLIFTLIAWLATPLVGLKFHEVQPGSPAAEAGLQPGDAIVAVDGRRFEFFGQDQILTKLRASAGETVTLTIEHPGSAPRDTTVTLRPTDQIDATHGALGISSPEGKPFEFPISYEGHDLATAIGLGASQTVHWFGVILGGLGDLATSFAADPTAPPPAAGPVGIARQIGDVFFGFGPIVTLYVAGILSANLALVNVLPFPPLDGGRMMVLVLKATYGGSLRGLRRIGVRVPGLSSETGIRIERLTYVAGFVVLFGFLIWVSGFDVLKILRGEL